MNRNRCVHVALSRGKAIGSSGMEPLRLHSSRRHLETHQGKPFFWLGDTAWELFHRLTRSEISQYLETRARQGFNLVQAVVLAELDGLRQPNRLGQVPFTDLESLRPNEAYFALVDSVLLEAERLGLYVALLPTWADKLTPDWGAGPVLFTASNPERTGAYARFLGQRYASTTNLIWVLGGDRPAIFEARTRRALDAADAPGAVDQRPIWRALAEGLRAGGAKQLMTYHQDGGPETARALHAEPWHDFTMFQSGHWQRQSPIWDWLEEHQRRQPPKPALDGEICYEDHGVNPWHQGWTPAEGFFRAADVRAQAYRSVFAGGCGVTYGHQSVWQFANPELYPPHAHPDIARWQDALTRPAAGQMRHLRALMETVGFVDFVPDQRLLKSNDAGAGPLWAMRDTAHRRALVYASGAGRTLELELQSLRGPLAARWFDPRSGLSSALEPVEGGSVSFITPGDAEDSVLWLGPAA